MGKDLYDQSGQAREFFEEANRIIGFRLTDVMFTGTEEDLKQTRVTQPVIFLHSVVLAAIAGDFLQLDFEAAPGEAGSVCHNFDEVQRGKGRTPGAGAARVSPDH